MGKLSTAHISDIDDGNIMILPPSADGEADIVYTYSERIR